MMDFIFELLFQIIPGKFWVFLLGILLIVGGIYVWRSGGDERSKYDLATDKESVSYMAEVRRKVVRSESSSQINDHDTGTVNVNYLDLMYDENDTYHSIDVQVDRDEYDAVKPGERIKISFHPDAPSYVVTPMKERPGTIWYAVGSVLLIGFGALIILMIVVSLF